MNDQLWSPEVAIIGGGPAGLRAARELAPKVNGDVVVIEREKQAGGIPRHADHPGYGIRDMKMSLSGPAYARRLVRQAEQAGALIYTEHQATGWAADGVLNLTTPDGTKKLAPKVFVLATGARERPRPARMIPGDRPNGVLTTGQLQQLVHLKDQRVGTNAVVVGAELVSWSAVMTLREAGCKTAALITQYDRPDSYGVFSMGGSVLFQTKVITHSQVVRINGRRQVESVEVEDLRTGERGIIPCDTVVFTGDWIPDNELARLGGLEMDPDYRGPKVDAAMRTSVPNVFAIGNLVHPVETADVAALDGKHIVSAVLDQLRDPSLSQRGVRLAADAPLRWISPSYVDLEQAPSRNRLVGWPDSYIAVPEVTATQNGRVVGRLTVPWACAPGRIFRIPSQILKQADVKDGEITISVKSRV